jgi:hypothetical protein
MGKIMAQISPEAARIAYVSGISELGSLAQRVIDLEAIVKTQQKRIETLEKSGTPVHLRDVERRTT